MKVFTAVEDYMATGDRKDDIKCFLAGGITNCPEWQDAVIKDIRSMDEDTKNLVLFNPRRKNFPIHDPNASNEQIAWEFEYLESCDIFSMYFCAGESDQPICMYEMGRNIVRMQQKFVNDWQKRIVISVEEGYRRFQDVAIQCKLAGISNVIVNKGYRAHAEAIVDAYKSLGGK